MKARLFLIRGIFLSLFLLMCGCVKQLTLPKTQNDFFTNLERYLTSVPDLGPPIYPADIPFPVGSERIGYLKGFTEGWCIVQEGNIRMLILPGVNEQYDSAWMLGAEQGEEIAFQRLEMILNEKNDELIRPMPPSTNIVTFWELKDRPPKGMKTPARRGKGP